MTVKKMKTMKRTKKMGNERRIFALAALAAMFAFAGCGRDRSVAKREAEERSSHLYNSAMSDFQAGRIDQAIAGFAKVLREEPRSFSAHFQLASILQDVKQDYVGAIAHFREYVDLQPDADKAALARDRIAICRRYLAAQYMKERPESEAEQKARAEREALEAEVKRLSGEKAKLEGELEGERRRAAALAGEVASLKKMVEGIAEGSSTPDRPARKHIPTDAELLDDDSDDSPARPLSDRIFGSGDAAELKIDESGPESPDRPAVDLSGRTVPAAALDSLFGAERGPKEKKPRSKGGEKNASGRPSVYIVQPGDTLYRISERFYGNSSHWRRIREANKDTISTDGRLQAGKEIKLP